MARSRHATWRALRKEARWDARDANARRTRLEKLGREIEEKRAMKRQVLEERGAKGLRVDGPAEIDAIPIRVKDEGPYVHYPATPDDLREVLRRLPPGVADGLALELVEVLIREHPGDLECLTAKADFLNHLDRNDEALEILRYVLSVNSEHEEAWRIRTLVSMDRKDWGGVVEATGNQLRFAGRRESLVLARQARALLELGRLDELSERIAELKAERRPFWKTIAFAFEAMALLRAGRFDDALRVAAAGLAAAGNTALHPELLAVRFEASCCLGRRGEDLQLEETTLERLERRGHEDWARRLRALAG